MNLILSICCLFAAPADGYAYPDPYPGTGNITAPWVEAKIATNWMKDKGNGEIVNLATLARLAKQITLKPQMDTDSHR